MYVPSPFQENDPEKLFDLIEANSFGLLISQREGEPFATHLPFLIERGMSPQSHGRLISHMAKGNPQWQSAEGSQVLAIFTGPHAYISPTWYAAENVVPTWNYVAVHAYGTFRAIEDAEKNRDIVLRFVEHYEASLPRPWSIDPNGSFLEKLLDGIVGFEIELSRLEGKWKLNQNHPRERRQRVIDALATASGENARAIGELMQQTLS